MILTGKQILEEINQGKIEITDFNEKNINPNSYDVTLASDFAIYKEDVLDMKKDNKLEHFTITDDGYILKPGVLYLARTNEKTITDHFAPMIEGRSSVGRLGIKIHATAGFGDVGFNGYWTLEISVTQQVKIYPNVRIGQVFFYDLIGKIELYNGKYQDNSKLQASKMFEDFATDTNVGKIEPTESDLALMDFYFKRGGCNWFAKDSDGTISCYDRKPEKRKDMWVIDENVRTFEVRHDLFHLSWENKEPYHYEPKVELKVGDTVWWYDKNKKCAVCDYIEEIHQKESVTKYITLEKDKFIDTVIGIIVFLTKEECENHKGD